MNALRSNLHFKIQCMNRFPEYLIKPMKNHILIEEDEIHKIVMRYISIEEKSKDDS